MNYDAGRSEPNICLQDHTNCTIHSCISNTEIKCTTVAGIFSEPSFTIDKYDLFIAKNVSKIAIIGRKSYAWDIEYNSVIEHNPEILYLYIDQIYDDAFAHWIFESSIYLFLFDKLKLINPNIKLLSFKKKNFKTIMYKAFNITDNDIHYEIKSPNNTILFPRATSQADHSNINIYSHYIHNVYTYFTKKIGDIQKDINILYFPRGTKENYIGNNRTIGIQPFLTEYITQLDNCLVYKTDEETHNMIDQVKLIRRSHILIVDMGSNFGVNSYFADNMKVICIGNIAQTCKENPRPYRLFHDTIIRGTKIYYVSSDIDIPDFVKFIDDVINDRIEPFNHPPYDPKHCWKIMCEPCGKVKL
jgi:hypothetical protein